VRVLVVDDHPIWRHGVARDLAEAGFLVVGTAADGRQALRIAGAARPQVILLDLHLPDMPGEEVLRRVWSNPETRPLPVAVLSADATPAQRQRLLASGAVAYLTKPIDLAQLLQLIDERLAADALPTRGG